MLSDMPVGFSNIVKYEWLEYTVRICIDVGRISKTNTDGNNEGVQSSGLDFKGQIGLFGDLDTQYSEVSTVKDSKTVKKYGIGRKEQALIREALHLYLADEVSVHSNSRNKNRDKTVSILSKIWSSVPPNVVELRDDALELYEEISDSERIVLHWGMTSAVYPFVFLVAETVGRLLRFQETFTLSQVRERVEGILGDRPTVYHALPKVLYSFVDWGVLKRIQNSKGVYAGTEPISIKNQYLIAWLLEAVLYAKGVSSLPLLSVIDSPGLFPFSIEPGVITDYVIRQNPRLTVFRHGMSEDMVGLAHK